MNGLDSSSRASDIDLVRRAIVASTKIDKVVAGTIARWTKGGEYTQLKEAAATIFPLDTTDPEGYLENTVPIQFWDNVFENWMKMWDNDELKYSSLSLHFGKLAAPATELDTCVAELIMRYGRYGNTSERRIDGILERQRSVNDFLSQCYVELEMWIKEQPEGRFVEMRDCLIAD